jgi:hypothetical protein
MVVKALSSLRTAHKCSDFSLLARPTLDSRTSSFPVSKVDRYHIIRFERPLAPITGICPYFFKYEVARPLPLKALFICFN